MFILNPKIAKILDEVAYLRRGYARKSGLRFNRATSIANRVVTPMFTDPSRGDPEESHVHKIPALRGRFPSIADRPEQIAVEQHRFSTWCYRREIEEAVRMYPLVAVVRRGGIA
jgi:hypothetical protein